MIVSEDVLVERLRRGDDTAFESLFIRHYSQVYRVLYNLVGNREEAEDLAQETFLTLYYQPPAAGTALVAWLCRVALNRGYNALRGQRRAQLRAERLAAPPDGVDPHAELLRAEERARVRAAIAPLPKRQGQLLLLRYAGLAYAEIADALGVAPASVGTLLARAERAFLEAYERLTQAEHEDTLDTRIL
jgi:RNA polymerase sigma-70 factor (ECF subfamily)